MPQDTAQPPSKPAKLTKKQRKGLAFRQKLGKRKSEKLGDLESEHAPVPESDIIHDDEGSGERENLAPDVDMSSSDRRRTTTLNGKAQQRRQEQKQSHGEGNVKTRDGESDAGSGTGTDKFTSGTERPSKKRKRPQVDSEGANLDLNAGDSVVNADAPSKPKRQKQELSEGTGEDDAGAESKDTKSLKQKTRYILFVGTCWMYSSSCAYT